MEIYWIENGKRRGPACVPDVISLIELGELSPQTPGWHSGCDGWQPLCCLPALVPYLRETAHETPDAAPPAPASPDRTTADAASGNAPASDTEHKPHFAIKKALFPLFRERLLARALDCSVYSCLAMLIIFSLRLPYGPYWQPGSVVFWLPMPILEGLSLYFFHTTPGKKIMGIQFVTPVPRVHFAQTLIRSLLVFFLGCGAMQPLPALFTIPFSAFFISTRGYCFWDIRSALFPAVPVSRRNLPGRFAVAAVAVIVCYMFTSYLMTPWLPEILDTLRTQWPEAADFFSVPR